jgi:uncharacterized membrane protein
MYSERPKILLSRQVTDRWLDTTSLLILLLTWTYTVVSYFSLPGQIPVHYNFKGIADSYGSRATVFILPAIITIIWAGLGVLNKLPHIFNYAVKITASNAERQYRAATRLIRVLKLVIVCFCLFVTCKVINAASTLEWWFLPAMLVSFLAPVVVYLFHSAKTQKTGKS